MRRATTGSGAVGKASGTPDGSGTVFNTVCTSPPGKHRLPQKHQPLTVAGFWTSEHASHWCSRGPSCLANLALQRLARCCQSTIPNVPSCFRISHRQFKAAHHLQAGEQALAADPGVPAPDAEAAAAPRGDPAAATFEPAAGVSPAAVAAAQAAAAEEAQAAAADAAVAGAAAERKHAGAAGAETAAEADAAADSWANELSDEQREVLSTIVREALAAEVGVGWEIRVRRPCWRMMAAAAAAAAAARSRLRPTLTAPHTFPSRPQRSSWCGRRTC